MFKTVQVVVNENNVTLFICHRPISICIDLPKKAFFKLAKITLFFFQIPNKTVWKS